MRNLIESKYFPALAAYAVLLALFLSVAGCTKKPIPLNPKYEITIIAPDAPSGIAEIDSAVVVPPVLPLSPRFYSLVFFSFDSDTLTDEADAVLQRAGGFLFDHPGYSLQVEGFADTVGREGYNDSLSQRRADRAWIAISAIASPRIGISHGNGETLGDPDRCRRVTIRILP